MSPEEESSDIIVSRLGEMGRWQLRTVLIVSTATLFTAWQTLTIGFLLPEVEFRCVRGENMTTAIKGEDIDWSSRFTNSSPFKDSSNETDHCKIYHNDSPEDCVEWVYQEEGSLVHEFNLVCSRDFLRSTASSVYMAGKILGVLTTGVLSDLYGRKLMILATSVLLALFSCATAAANSMITFIALRFFVAAAAVSLYTCVFVYCIELVGGIWNVIIGIGFGFPWATSYMLVPLVAYLLPYWAHTQLVVSAPLFLFCGLLLVPGLIPESPKWLYLHNRQEEAESILKAAEEFNGIDNSNKPSLSKVKESESGKSDTWRWRDILQSPHYPHTIVCTLVMFYLWFTNALVYYGLLLNAGSFLPGDIYINTFVAGVLEFAAPIVTIVVFIYGGRRYVQAGTLTMAGVCLLLTLTTSDITVKIVLSQIGKFAITSSFLMVYLYAAEIFPTIFRSSGMGMSSFFARIGSIIAPFAGRELRVLSTNAPIWLFGLVSLAAGVLALALPETKGTKLPDTLKDGELMMEARPGIFRKCLSSNEKRKVKEDEIFGAMSTTEK